MQVSKQGIWKGYYSSIKGQNGIQKSKGLDLEAELQYKISFSADPAPPIIAEDK